MNEINKIEYDLNNEGLFILTKLSKWNRIIGIIFIIMGIVSLLGIFTDSSNLPIILFTILISIFMVFLGTRLTAAAANFKISIINSDPNTFKTALDNLRQYFMITGIFYFAGFFIMILIIIFGAIFGFGAENLYDI